MAEAAAASTERRKALGESIRAARKTKGWKQKQLAAAVSVEPMTVSRWERGQHAPDIDMIELIAHATEKPLSHFVQEPLGQEAGAEEEFRLEIRGQLAALVKAVRRLEDRLAGGESPPASAGSQ